MFRSLDRVVLAVSLCALVAVPLAVSGCSAGSPPPVASPDRTRPAEPRDGGTLRYCIREPAGIRPGDLHGDDGTQVAQTIFDSLTQVDSLNPSLVLPSAAETWTVNADMTVWTFTLDRDRKFHEGTPVTATDFAYAWNRIGRTGARGVPTTSTVASAPVALTYVLGWDAVRNGVLPVMPGVQVIDDVTLQVTLSRPYADFDCVVADPSLAPLPRKYVEEGIDYEGTKVPFSEMPVGNGPFKMAAPWSHNREIKVVRNGDYRGTMPHLDAIDFTISGDLGRAFEDFERGKLDFARIPRTKLATAVIEYGESANGYVANPHRQVLRGAENTVDFLTFNTSDKYLRDPELRRAISLAVNRKAVCEVVFAGTRGTADNAVPPGVAGYQESGWADSRFDVAAASAALRAAGHANGRGLPELVLAYESGLDAPETAARIQSDLAAVGVRVALQPVDWREYRARLEAGAYQFALTTYDVKHPTMDAALAPLFDSESRGDVSGYSSAAFDQGLDAARSTSPWNARIARYLELNYVVQQANPMAPITFHRHHHVVSERVHDLIHSAQGLTDFSRVWLDDAEDE